MAYVIVIPAGSIASGEAADRHDRYHAGNGLACTSLKAAAKRFKTKREAALAKGTLNACWRSYGEIRPLKDG